MEYNELVKALRCDGNNIGQDSGGCTNKKCRYRDPDSACNIVSICEDAATAITDLLARAEAAEVRCKTLEKMVREYQNVIVPGYRERAEKAEHALAHMWYAFQNKDDDFPHEYEKEALSQAENILGKWEDVMQNMMKEE